MEARAGTERIPANWTAADIPSQRGRVALVTGTGGIGWETALGLARAGAEVIIAGRNACKGAEAVVRIRREAPQALVAFEQVDLASLASVAALGARLRGERECLHVLINNAAVMNPPVRQETADRLELQFGTNYLGHYALTAALMPLLRKGMDARVVTLSSIAARDGALRFEDLQAQRGYSPMRAYSQSKLACLMFALELQRRSEAGGWGLASIAAHPGIARTDLLHNAPGRWSAAGLARTLLWFLFQPAAQGALPGLFAATSPLAQPGGYYGPASLFETRGAPAVASIPRQALDEAAARRLWDVSARLAGVTPGAG
ncbi:short chain dehydrogenase [Verrucomicrobia bacterium LW23]|nr:short chain dehydrogenase [Verrucomicrobia bacterium LW23]